MAGHLCLKYYNIYQFFKHFVASGSKENAYHTLNNPKYSPYNIRIMVRSPQKDAQSRRSPLKDIGKQNCDMSARKVSRHLKKAGILSYKATRAPLLSTANKKKRLGFALEHRSWTQEDWHMVLWTDESAVEKQDSRHYSFLRRPQEKFHPACIQLTTKSGTVKVMAWGCFIGLQRGPLIKMPSGSIESKEYMDNMEKEVFSWFKGLPEGAIQMHSVDDEENHGIYRHCLLCKPYSSSSRLQGSSPPGQAPLHSELSSSPFIDSPYAWYS